MGDNDLLGEVNASFIASFGIYSPPIPRKRWKQDVSRCTAFLAPEATNSGVFLYAL